MTTFVISGLTGKVGSNVSRILHERGAPFVVGARTITSEIPEGYKVARFDWSDPSTFENAFKADPNIDRLFFVSPPDYYPLPVVQPFLDYAIPKRIKRVLFIGGSSLDRSSKELTGPIWDYLAKSGVEYTVLRPTWFTENFLTFHQYTIKNFGFFNSACEDGGAPFISSVDLAEASVDALLKEESLNDGVYVVGPELLTNDQAAEIISNILGKKVIHKRLTYEEMVNLRKPYTGEDLAKSLTDYEIGTAKGKDEELFKRTDVIRGKLTLRQVIEANKQVLLA